MAKDYIMRSQTPVFDVWLLTVSEPPPSLFPSCPQQLIRKPDAPSFGEGGDSSTASDASAGTLTLAPSPHPLPRPQQNLSPLICLFSAISDLPGLPALLPSETSVVCSKPSHLSWCVRPLSASTSETNFGWLSTCFCR